MNETLLMKFGCNFTCALLVISGYYGNGDERKTKLEEDGYDYTAVQKIVNAILPYTKE